MSVGFASAPVVGLRVGVRMGRAALLRKSRLSLSMGSAVGVAGLAAALTVTSLGSAAVACADGNYACSAQRTSTLFAVIALPVLAVLVVITRTSLLNRIAPYVRLHAMGATRPQIGMIAATESLTVASPGVAVGFILTAFGLAVSPLAIDPWEALSRAALASVVTLTVVAAVTSLSLPLQESRTLVSVRTGREAVGRVASGLWVTALGVLIYLAVKTGKNDAYSTAQAATWVISSVIAVLTLPSAVSTCVALFGRALEPLADRFVSLRMAVRQMQWQPGSLARAVQVLAAGVAVAIAAQFVWIAVAATPTIATVITAQTRGPNLLVFSAGAPTDVGPVTLSADYVVAPQISGYCSDSSCGVLVLPCEFIAAALASHTPTCDAPTVYTVAPNAAPEPGATVLFDNMDQAAYTLDPQAVAGRGDLVASFFAQYFVTAIVTPDAITDGAPATSRLWLVLAPPGVTGNEVLAPQDTDTWVQAGGLSTQAIAEVQSTQRQVLSVAWLALGFSLIGLLALSFDAYADRSRMARRWERFGVPRRIGTTSFVLSQVAAATVACSLGCATGALIAWNLGYTTVDSITMGSRWQPVILTSTLGMGIVVLNSAALILGERLARQAQV